MLLHGAALLLLLLAAVAHAQQTTTTHPADGEHAILSVRFSHAVRSQSSPANFAAGRGARATLLVLPEYSSIVSYAIMQKKKSNLVVKSNTVFKQSPTWL